MKEYFCVLGGGGIRGAAYTGAIKALNELNIKITGYGGSSIGAVVSGLIAAGYNLDEIEEIFENIDLGIFKDLNFKIGKDFALSKGENFYDWIKNKIESKAGSALRFKDLEGELIISAVDLVKMEPAEFSKRLTPDVEIAFAIRASVGMPGLYAPVFDNERCLVDGDLLKSSPFFNIHKALKDKKERILEFRLENDTLNKKISNTFEYLNAVYDVTSGSATDFIIEKYKNHDKYDFIKLDSKGVSIVDFMVSKDKKRQMAKTGYDSVMAYFKEFYPKKQKNLKNLYELLLSGIKKVLYYMDNKDAKAAKREMAELLAGIIEEKEILDSNLFKEIISYKKFLYENYLTKNAFFFLKSMFLDYDSAVKKGVELKNKIQIKLDDFQNGFGV